MSAVIADPAAVGVDVPVKRGKKKLIVLAAAVLAVALAAGGGALWIVKMRAHAVVEGTSIDEGPAAEAAQAGNKPDPRTPPIYLPLDPFVVNLADKENDRYAQIGITLELESSVFADQMKVYMPAVRNAILLILAHKTAKELLGRAGKEELAEEIMREAIRPMGIEIAVPEPVTVAPVVPEASGAEKAQDEAAPIKKIVKRRGTTLKNPIQHVHFSSFIIQ